MTLDQHALQAVELLGLKLDPEVLKQSVLDLRLLIKHTRLDQERPGCRNCHRLPSLYHDGQYYVYV